MRIYYFFFIISSFSAFSQKKDILIIDGNKYEGEIIEYFNKDFKYGNSGYILFDNGLGQDTIIISSDDNYKIKLRRFNSFFEFQKKSWNEFEFGFDFQSGLSSKLLFSKGIFNDKILNPGIGIGIFKIDQINFIPFYFSLNKEIFPINIEKKKNSKFRTFIYQNIGYSIGRDFGDQDYISTDGGFYFNLGIGFKKSTYRNNHIALKIGYLIQRYKSVSNMFWDNMGFPILNDPSSSNNNIIRRNGSFRGLSITFSLIF